MTGLLRNLYYGLPYPLRSVAASVHGYRLQRLRYSVETERLVAEFTERDTWTRYRWKRWIAERQASMLHHAATKVPYYREQWRKRRLGGDQSSWEVLENWPILDKSALRRQPEAFLAEGSQRSQLHHSITSGTTGTPVDLWFSRETIRAWYAMFEARCRRWNGVSGHDNWALLAGQAVADPRTNQPPFWVWNKGLRQLYLSSYHSTPANAGHYVEAMRRHGVRYLIGYPSSLYPLAQGIVRDGLEPPQLDGVITESEQFFSFQRSMIERAFRCPVRDSFGMSEICAGGGECVHGSMHLWPDAGTVEVLVDGEPAAPGQTGELACTGLLNADMPLIRYRVGDRGQLAAEGFECQCGRTLPVLETIEGRISDVILAHDGRRLSPNLLEGIFDGRLPVEEAQIVQSRPDEVTIRLVPAPAYSDAAARVIEREVANRLGPVRVNVETVARIPRGPNGKLRAVVSSLVEG